MNTTHNFSKRQLTQIVTLHKRATISLWLAISYLFLLLPLAEAGLLQAHPMVFFKIFVLIALVSWFMFMHLRTRLGHPLYEQALISITCVPFPFVVLFWILEVERNTDRLLSTRGIEKNKLGFYKSGLIKNLDIPLCDECLYDMGGLEDASACPECGSPFGSPMNEQTPAAA